MTKSLQILLFSFFLIGQFVNAQCDVSENFDTYVNNDIPIDWTVINTTGVTSNVYAKVQSSNQAPTPPRYLRMYNGAATTGDLMFVAPQVANTSDGNHRVKFWLQGTSTSMLELGTLDAVDGSGTFSLISTFSLSNVWTYYEVTIPAGTNQYLAFKHNLADTFDQINFDSICLQEIPTCLEVSNITLANPTTTTLDLSWAESGTGEDNWEYIVQEVGAGAPTPATAGTAFSSTDANPTTTVTNLTMDTDYEAYVRANCGGGDFGEWILANNTLRTDCGLITENYCEDWHGLPEDIVPYCWSAYDDPTTSGYVKVDYEFSGYNKNMLELFFTSTTALGDIVAISPDVSFAMDGEHRLNFTAGGSTNAPDALEIGTIDALGDFHLITSITPTSDRNTQYFVPLPNNDHVSYAFRHNGAINKYIWINTVCVEDTPTCLEVTDVVATNVQYNAADISWTTSVSNETDWEYLVQDATAAAPDATTSGTEISTNSVTVSLQQNTAYVAYARAKCATDDFGSWIASAEFTTACADFVANYNDSFEGVNVNAEEIKPCWSVFDNTIGDFKTFGSSYNIDPVEGDLMLRMYFTSTSNLEELVLMTPEFSDLNIDKQLRFKMNKRANNEADMNVIVGTVADPSDMSTFTVLDDTSLNQTTIVADTWTEFVIDLSGYDTTLGHSYIAFKPQHSGTGATQYLFMDDFNYEYVDSEQFNDEPETANVLTASTDYTCNNARTGDFVNATQSEEFPCASPTFGDFKDLWFRFTPDSSGEHAFALENITGEDMNMYVYEGSSVNPIPINSGCSTHYITTALQAGTTYFVSIASDVPTAQYELCVFPLPPTPSNDETTGAIALTESTDNSCSNATGGYTASATHSVESECGADSLDVWYTFTPTTTANYTFRRDIINGGGVTYMSVYEGTPSNLTQITDSCTSYLQTVDLVAGETYYVAVSSSVTSIPVYFNLCVYQSPPAPANDECSDSETLTVGLDFQSSFIVGNNTSATRNIADPLVLCDGLEFEEKGKDVWYNVTVPNSGRLVLETKYNDDPYLTDPGMQAYAGTCSNLESLYCSSDEGDGFFNYIELTDLQPGTEILVRVWGRVGTFGEYKIAAYDDSPTCAFPSNIEIEDITETTAFMTFDAPDPAPTSGYEYILQPAGTGYPGAATGVSFNSTEVLLSNLTPNTEYEIYVKSLCSTNGSAWEGPVVFTTEEVLGTTDFDTDTFTFYPNPVKNILNVSNNEVIEYVNVYDFAGKKVKTSLINNISGQVDMSGLSAGLYMLEAKTALDTKVFKVIVE
tara:strand:- start:81990 stop:85844 length:3855 start_codon:yes stop_codon:yes gene_type:complete